MISNTFHLSKLKCEPNKVPPVGPDYYGPPEGYTFWRIFIDDQILTDFAQPFTAYDPQIELFGNQKVPYWGDGDGFVSVRKTGYYVVWCRPLEDWLDVSPGIPYDEFIVFDAIDYAKTLNSLQLPITTLHPNWGRNSLYSENFRSDTPNTSPPQLQAIELQSLLMPYFPANDLPLYRVPERIDDVRGGKILRNVKAAIQNIDNDLSAVETPANWFELRIGLDLPEFVECIWRIGQGTKGCTIQFVEKPHFPLWLCSSTLTKALAAECV